MKEEQLESNFQRVQEWIKSADDKVSILLAFDGVFLLYFVEKILQRLLSAYQAGSPYVASAYALALALFAWSIFKCLWVVYPRLRHRQVKGSLLYFRDISAMSYEVFSKDVDAMNVKSYKEALKQQIHACSLIAHKKFTAFKDAITLTVISFALLSILEIWLRSWN